MTQQPPHPRSQHRLERRNAPSLRNWYAKDQKRPDQQGLAENVSVDCGWGRLLFAHTFPDLPELAKALREETQGRRDIALYLRDPHVALSLAPQELFLDPAHT